MSYVHHLSSLLNASTKNNNGVKWTVADYRPEANNEVPLTPIRYPWKEIVLPETTTLPPTTIPSTTTAPPMPSTTTTTERTTTTMEPTTTEIVTTTTTTVPPTTKKPPPVTTMDSSGIEILPEINSTNLTTSSPKNMTDSSMKTDGYNPVVVSLTMLPLLSVAFILNILALSLLIKKKGTKLLGHLSHTLFATLTIRNTLYCIFFLTPMFVHLAYGFEGYFCVYLGVVRLFLELVALWTNALLVVGCLLDYLNPLRAGRWLTAQRVGIVLFLIWSEAFIFSMQTISSYSQAKMRLAAGCGIKNEDQTVVLTLMKAIPMVIITGGLVIAGIHYFASLKCYKRSVEPEIRISPSMRSMRSVMRQGRSPRMIRPQPINLAAPAPPSEPVSPMGPQPLESMFKFSRAPPPPPPLTNIKAVKELTPESAHNLLWSFVVGGLAVLFRIPGIFVQFFPSDTLQGAAGLMEALDLLSVGSVVFGGVWGFGTGLRKVFN